MTRMTEMRKMKKAERSGPAGRILALLTCIAVLGAMLPVSSQALSKGVYTASVVTSYYNPDTGAVDDGGTANAALGEGMCRSATGTTALVESDGKNTWVTIRLLLQSNCKNVALYTRNGYNSYSKVNYTVMQENAGEDSIDYRFKVSDAGVKMKGTMYVTPMGRDVIWYLYINTGTLKAGSGDFVVSIDTSEPAPVSAAGASSGSSSGSKSPSASSSAAASGGSGSSPAKAGGGASDDKAADASGSDSEDGEDSENSENGESGDAGEELTDGVEDKDGGSDEDKTGDDADEKAEKTSAKVSSSQDEAGVSGAAVAVIIVAAAAVAAGGATLVIRRRRK